MISEYQIFKKPFLKVISVWAGKKIINHPYLPSHPRVLSFIKIKVKQNNARKTSNVFPFFAKLILN